MDTKAKASAIGKENLTSPAITGSKRTAWIERSQMSHMVYPNEIHRSVLLLIYPSPDKISPKKFASSMKALCLKVIHRYNILLTSL
jgi:hypothetical protein